MKFHAAPPPRPDYDPRACGAKCDECPLNGSVVVPPEPTRRPAMILIGEAPGDHEAKHGRPFIGPTGMWLEDEVLAPLKIAREDMHITNALLCQPPRKGFDTKKWKAALAACRPRLVAELQEQDARTIAAVGRQAMTVTTGKGRQKEFVGAILPGNNGLEEFTVIPNYHPTFVAFRARGLKPVFQLFFRRAWEHAEDRLPKWQWPEFHTEPNKAMLASLRRMYKSSRAISVDVENNGTKYLMAVGLSNGTETVSLPWDAYSSGKYGPVRSIEEYGKVGADIKNLVLKLLASPKHRKVMHNGLHDMWVFGELGIKVKAYEHDTLLSHATVAPQIPHGLQYACGVEFPMPRWKTEFNSGEDAKGLAKFVKADQYELRTYNARDAYMTYLLYAVMKTRLERTHNGWELFTDYMEKSGVALRMRQRGIQADPRKFGYWNKYLRRRQSDALRELRKITTRFGMPEFNPNSHEQMARLFFQNLHVVPSKYSEKTEKPSLDEEVLGPLQNSPDPLTAVVSRGVLRYRKFQKLRKTYVVGLPVTEQWSVHSNLNVHGARTGRMSSSEPNMQNIPKPKYGKRKNGKKYVVSPGLRELFCARPGMWMVEADYKMLELIIAAFLSNAKKLLHMINNGVDVHTATAKLLLNKTEVDKGERDLAKGFEYGANYGAEAETLWKALRNDYPLMPLSMVQKMLLRWQKEHPELVQWRDKELKLANERLKKDNSGYVEIPISGRRHYFYGKVEQNKVFNYPIQGTGADIIDPAFKAIDRELRWDSGEAILLQVHDSLVLEGPDPVRLYGLLHKHMARTVTLNGVACTFPIDVKMGKNWGHLVEVASEAEIRQVMADPEMLNYHDGWQAAIQEANRGVHAHSRRSR